MNPLSNAIFAKGGVIYEISDEDVAGDPSYFGYLTLSGHWIIQKRTGSAGTYRYVQGASAYPTAWTNRASLVYATYDTLNFNI